MVKSAFQPLNLLSNAQHHIKVKKNETKKKHTHKQKKRGNSIINYQNLNKNKKEMADPVDRNFILQVNTHSLECYDGQQ